MGQTFDAWMDGVKEILKGILVPLKDYCIYFSDFWVGLGVITLIFFLFLGFSIARQGKEFPSLIRKPSTLAVSSLLIALNIVLGYFTIWISSYLRISFGFITQPIIAVLFGPLVCCITGMAQDILAYLLNPSVGGLLPVYTLCVGISGMVYGLMLYRKPVSLWRIFLTKALIQLIINTVLNSIALAPTVGSGFIGILPARLIKNVLLLPIQTVVVYLILEMLKRSRLIQKFHG